MSKDNKAKLDSDNASSMSKDEVGDKTTKSKVYASSEIVSIGDHDISREGILLNVRNDSELNLSINEVREAILTTVLGKVPLVLSSSDGVTLMRWLMNSSNLNMHKLYDIAAGGYVILGSSGSGKTTFVNSIEEANVDLVASKQLVSIIASEPDRRSVSLAEGILSLAAAMLMGTKVVIMDSIRGIVYSGEGSTLSGGVSSYLINFVESISRLASGLGCAVFLTVNPLQDNQERFNMLREAILGSSTGLLNLGNDGWTGKLEMTSRYFPDRNPFMIEMHNFGLMYFLKGNVDRLKSTHSDKDGYVKTAYVSNNSNRPMSRKDTYETAFATYSDQMNNQATKYDDLSSILNIRMPHGYKNNNENL